MLAYNSFHILTDFLKQGRANAGWHVGVIMKSQNYVQDEKCELIQVAEILLFVMEEENASKNKIQTSGMAWLGVTH